MFKFTLRLSITFLLSFLITTSSVFSFHEDGTHVNQIDATEGQKKKDVQSEYCTSIVEKGTITVEIENIDDENNKNESNSEKKTIEEKLKEFDVEQEENNNKLKVSKIVKKIFKFRSYHSSKVNKAPEILDISILKDMKQINAGTTVEQLLSYYCLQPATTEARKYKFSKNSNISKLYDKIAEINGLLDENGNGDRNFSIQGDILDKAKIYLNVEEPLIYFEAYLITEERKNIEDKKAADAVAAAEAAKEAAKKQAEKDWITKNKQTLLNNIDEKITEFDDQIKEINDGHTSLKKDYENFRKYFKEKSLEVEDLLDLVDVGQKQIKDVAIKLKKAKREHLNSIIIDDFKSKFKETKKVKGKHYSNYKKLDKLRDEVDGSDKKRKFTNKKKGYLVQWERLKVVKLNDKQKDKIDDLSKEIAEAEKNIVNNIDPLILEIQNLEEELDARLPIKEIVIGFVIFLIICGVGYFIYDTTQKRKREKKDSESKIASLKSDFEGKLKDTSEQIKRAGRGGAAQQQKTPTQEPEKPKTQEEIIASKYDDLLSDYRDSLDDFSKVAAFKQKWNGLALSRKERQDGTKTILINSTRAFEKAEIWCVNFSDKYFAFPGSSVKSSMAAYMNMDFEKASRDFKGVFAISSGSSYSTEPAVLRRGGAGFVVERAGKLIFPN